MTATNDNVWRVGKLQFEIFRKDEPRNTAPSITLTKGREVAVNTAAARLFGQHEYVLLGYDPQRRSIGIKPTTASERGASKVCYTQGSSRKGRYGFNVNAGAFFDRYALTHSNTRRFEAECEDGTLYLYLDRLIGVVGRGGHITKNPGAK